VNTKKRLRNNRRRTKDVVEDLNHFSDLFFFSLDVIWCLTHVKTHQLKFPNLRDAYQPRWRSEYRGCQLPDVLSRLDSIKSTWDRVLNWKSNIYIKSVWRDRHRERESETGCICLIIEFLLKFRSYQGSFDSVDHKVMRRAMMNRKVSEKKLKRIPASSN
jgi:hypothetical protein